MTAQLSGWLATALVAAAVLTWPSRRQRTVRRLTAIVGTRGPRRRAAAGRPGNIRLLGAVIGGCGVTLLIGLPWGLPVGALVGVAGYLLLSRLEPAAVRRRKEQIAADLPVAVDLLAACHRSGSSSTTAASVVSEAVGGPVGAELRRVVSLLRLGGDPVEAWAVLRTEPLLAPLGRAIGRAMSSGAPVAEALTQVAREAREQRRTACDEAARKVGVRAALPLGLCFLPAFVVLGVVPVVAGLASTIDLW